MQVGFKPGRVAVDGILEHSDSRDNIYSRSGSALKYILDANLQCGRRAQT
jgi:hypothetical protein